MKDKIIHIILIVCTTLEAIGAFLIVFLLLEWYTTLFDKIYKLFGKERPKANGYSWWRK